MSEYQKIRVSVRSICIVDNKILLQTDLNDSVPTYATVGGELESGETMEERLKLEYKEETGMDIEIKKYLFVIENFFLYNDKPLHSLEHFFLVNIASTEFSSKEKHLSFHWIPVEEIEKYEIKPKVLKELILKGELDEHKHLISRG
ncbi:MAG: NUDIX domain-containing protein [Bacteroidetes bacterium]|nr:NUDIX domain-containing protein [Bacteroidota bacterium]